VNTDTLYKAMRHAIKQLRQARIATAGYDARLLVQWVTGVPPLDTVTRPERPVSPEESQKLDAALQRRIAGEPVHRIIGERAFYGLDFTLSADTLEPRPDTETVIDLTLPFLQARAAVKPAVTCLDMGTGSGAIAIALLASIPQLYATGVDIAQGALTMAQLNAGRSGVANRFTPCKSDWFQSVTGRFDLIVSNPPYIPRADIAGTDISVHRFDPVRALDGGIDGLDFYRALAAGAKPHLYPSGKIAVEIGTEQKQNVTAIFAWHNYRLEETKADLAGIDRALLFTQNQV